MRIIKEKRIIDPNVKIDFFRNVISSFFFTGYFPKASGTIASLAALLIFLLDVFRKPVPLIILTLTAFVLGIFTSKVMMKKYGDDPSVVVIDEAVGMWITVLIFLICSSKNLSLFYISVSFFAFRFFDITKLQPAKYFDDLNSEFGIMMDDVIAGIYAGVLVCLVSMVL